MKELLVWISFGFQASILTGVLLGGAIRPGRTWIVLIVGVVSLAYLTMMALLESRRKD